MSILLCFLQTELRHQRKIRMFYLYSEFLLVRCILYAQMYCLLTKKSLENLKRQSRNLNLYVIKQLKTYLHKNTTHNFEKVGGKYVT